MAIRNAMTAIEWPDDALSVFATLRGPLFALTDDQLLAFKGRCGSLHPLRTIDSSELDDSEREVADSLVILRDLHINRNRQPIADTVAGLLTAVRAHAGIAIWPTGEQALANCLRVVDRARRFERRGAASFRAFVELLEDEAELGTTSDAPVVEEGSEGVRLMTVHKAKGLEFPVVILADLTCGATHEDPAQFVNGERKLWAEPLCDLVPRDLLDNRDLELERERAEGVRVAYVAATRAKDLLVVPSVCDEAQPGWLEALNPALYPKRSVWRLRQPAPGCPDFGLDAVVERPGRAQDGEGVAPGQHTAEAGNEVVWWDPNVLGLGAETSVGLRQDKLLRADESGLVASEGIEAHRAWQARRQQSIERGSIPALHVESVTGNAAAGPQLPEANIEVVYLDAERKARPRGARFGALVHVVLALVDLDADEHQIRAVAAAQSLILGAPTDEAEAASETARAALRHPLLRRAAKVKESVRREASVMLQIANDRVVEGILDLAFREQTETRAEWTVVDFKTDHELGRNLDAYERQLSLYVKAVEVATSEAAHGILLVV